MRIGVLPGASRAIGGAFQYSLAMLDALDPRAAVARGDELVLFAQPESELDLDAMRASGWRVEPSAPPRTARDRVRAAGRRLSPRRSRVPRDARVRPELQRWLRRTGVELCLYPVPTLESFQSGIPYVTAVHDLQHRLQPEFPEVSAGGEAEWREYLFRNTIRNALIVLVDSETGKEDVLACYEGLVRPERIAVLPFMPTRQMLERPGDSVDAVLARYRIERPYLFYPAQFWPHKNHATLIEAMGELARRDVAVDLVLSGSHGTGLLAETRARVLARAAELGLGERVHDLGYVADEHMPALYRGALALVMPTFFGPTNIPVVEAWALGCPVLTSDIRGIREQVGDAALLADPRSADALAHAVERIVRDEELRRALAGHGRAKLMEYGPDEFRARVVRVVEEAKALVREETP